MSEFKFACPVCGQHITADSANTGSQLECPTCYRKIVVPQAPTATDPKFILSAAEANKPRPPQLSLPTPGPLAKKPSGSAIPVIAVVVVLLVAGTALAVFREKIFGPKNPAGAKSSIAQNGEANDEDPGKKARTPSPVVTNDIAWNLELAGAAFPEAAVAGKLRGEFVSCNRSWLQPGMQGSTPVVGLALRQMTRGLPDLGVTIYFFVRQPDELRGKTIKIATNDSPAPRVTIRSREGKDTKTDFFNSGYALKLEFGDVANNHLSGKIYLSLPDEAQSRVAGTFSAEIRRPQQPRGPRPAKPNSGG